MTTVLVTAPTLAPEAVAMLEGEGHRVAFTGAYPDGEALRAALAKHRPVAVVHRQGVVDGDALDAGLPDLRVVARHGAGVDGIDLDAARARGVAVTRAAGANAAPVAEHAVALMLALLKDLPGTAAAMAAGAWEKTTRTSRDVEGARLGIVGYGAIGSRVARIADAMGMRVAALDPFLPPGPLPGPGERADSLDALLARSEVLSLHGPLDPTTRGLIGGAEFARMPRGALLVHTARGGMVDEEALLEALNSGQIGGAGLDVFALEPLAADSPLRRHPRVIATPHLAASTPRGKTGMATSAAASILAVLSGREPDAFGALVVPPGLTARAPAPAPAPAPAA